MTGSTDFGHKLRLEGGAHVAGRVEVDITEDTVLDLVVLWASWSRESYRFSDHTGEVQPVFVNVSNLVTHITRNPMHDAWSAESWVLHRGAWIFQPSLRLVASGALGVRIGRGKDRVAQVHEAPHPAWGSGAAVNVEHPGISATLGHG
jgi:hypothetical protein